MTAKRFALIWFVLVLLSLAGLVGFNGWVDPLWLGTHENAWNTRQWGFDERQQKTNRLRFGEVQYNALLFGSSRSSYISQKDFTKHLVFNYSAGGMRPAEFSDYLDFAVLQHGKPFNVVYLGLDFFAANATYPSTAAKPSMVIQRNADELYRLSVLLSEDTLRKSIRYARDSKSEFGCDCYDRHNVKFRPARPKDEAAAALAEDLEMYRKQVYANFEYDATLRKTLEGLRIRNPETHFVAFTTPESKRLFDLVAEMGLTKKYRLWLDDITSVFGGVYVFSGDNSVTREGTNYADGHHFYPQVGTWIAKRLENRLGVPEDFGVWVANGQVDAYLRKQSLGTKNQ